MPNPFAAARWYSKLSNIFLAPAFRLTPMPRGFALLTVTGRRTGKPRRRPIRAIRLGNTLYAAATLGERSDWLRNVRKQPRVRAKVGGRTYDATAREVTNAAERLAAEAAYIDEVPPFDYVDYVSLEWAFPTRRAIIEAHRRWLARGVLVGIDLEGA
ncbi:MAG: nitroreductase family deazaflavin-dependent oxidoreductase [Dehalococcoidia bacterium]